VSVDKTAINKFQVNVRVDYALYSELSREASKWKTTKSAIIREALIRELLRRREQNAAGR
tara:strand:- start:519 stop:698 length:180 start_codon:yes stop_codon:yes gene_type:complete